MGGKLPPSGILFEGSIFWLTEDDRFLIDPYEKIAKKRGESQTKQQQFFSRSFDGFFPDIRYPGSPRALVRYRFL